MTAPAPSPAPAKRSKRMVVWLVAVPIVILLLALAGANWKRFHLAYAKHLMGSDDPEKQGKGVLMVLRTHSPMGTHLEEVRRLLAPSKVVEIGLHRLRNQLRPFRPFGVPLWGDYTAVLSLDEEDRLRDVFIWEGEKITDIPLPGK